MSTVTIIVIAASVIATIVFAAGFWRGVRNAINDYGRGTDEDREAVPQDGHWGAIGFAVLASIVSIVGIGFTPAFVYVGPFLVIVTTIGVGVAFFIEKEVPPSRPSSSR